MEMYGEIILETKGNVIRFDIEYASCILSGNNPISLNIDFTSTSKTVMLEEDFVKTVSVEVYILRFYNDFISVEDCFNRLNEVGGECGFFLDGHEELYDIVVRSFRNNVTTIDLEIAGKTADIISTRHDEYTNVTIKSRLEFKNNTDQ